MKPCLLPPSPKCENSTMKKCIFESSLDSARRTPWRSKHWQYGNSNGIRRSSQQKRAARSARSSGGSAMLSDIRKVEHIYIACGYTDLRRGIDGLAQIVQNQFSLVPCSNSRFLFCGRKRDRIKALLWEGDGFVLLSSPSAFPFAMPRFSTSSSTSHILRGSPFCAAAL